MAKGKCGKVIYRTELDAKIALARLVWKDKGQRRVQPCNICRGRVYHLTSQERRSEPTKRIPQSIDGNLSRAIGSAIASTVGGS